MDVPPPDTEDVDNVGAPGQIPRIPASVTRNNISLLYNIWDFAVPRSSAESIATRVPKTVLAPSPHVMRLLIPGNNPHPLYDEIPENVELRRNFLLDYMIMDAVEHSGQELLADGVTYTNLGGKHLLFKTAENGQLTINGIIVVESTLLPDGTRLFILDDLLFDHKTKVEEALEILHQQSRESTFGDLGSPTGPMESLPVPAIPLAVDRGNSSSLIHMWRHALRNQTSSGTTGKLQEPKTVLSPTFGKPEGPNPLYNELPENVALRSEILRDYLIVEHVEYNNEAFRSPHGYTVKNMNGKDVTFKRLAGGNLLINGINATPSVKVNPQVYQLEYVLFDHKEKREAALKIFLRKFKSGALGEPLDAANLSNSSDANVVPLPQVPESVEEEHASSLLYLWQYALNNQLTTEPLEPMTVLYPDFKVLSYLLPPDPLQPLYSDCPEIVEFRREFILDYLIREPVNTDDPRMTMKCGLITKNFIGKTIIFRKDMDGIISINDTVVTTRQENADRVWTYCLSDYLFDHSIMLDKFFHDSYDNDSDEFKTTEGVPLEVLMSFPRALENTPSVTWHHVWQRALDIQDEQGIPRDDREPKTILALPIQKIVSILPFAITHDMTDIQKATFLETSREIINDYLIVPYLSPADERLTSPEGVTIRNSNNKLLTFKMEDRSYLTINGVTVTWAGSIRRHAVFSISDCLFNNERLTQYGEFDVASISTTTDSKSRSISPVSNEETSLVPRIPHMIERGKLTKLINLWKHALNHQDYLTTLNDDRVPMTVLSPGFSAMTMVPPGAPHPLFDSILPENAALRNEIILDYLVLAPVAASYFVCDADQQYNVYTVTNINGKILNFTRNPSGKFFVNGVGVEEHLEVSNELMVYHLEDFLFDHKPRVSIAKDKLMQLMLQDNPGDLHLDRFYTPGIKEVIPKIPDIVVKEQATSMIDVWRIALRHQNPRKMQMATKVPKTLISPQPEVMVNLIPLVDESNASLRAQFLLDYMLPASVSPYNPKMDLGSGITVENLNKRNINFYRDSTGLFINDILAKEDRTLPDGTEVYRISSLLFEHRKRIDEIFDIMNSQVDDTDHDTGPNTDVSSPSISPVDPSLETIPGIPDMVKMSGGLPIYAVWYEAVMYQGSTATARDERVPKTILSPVYSVLESVFPTGKPNPLMEDSIESAMLRISFLKDLFLLEPINMKQEFMEKENAKTYKTYSGKEVKIFKNAKGDLEINGVGVMNIEVLRDGIVIMNIKDFLFDHRKQFVKLQVLGTNGAEPTS